MKKYLFVIVLILSFITVGYANMSTSINVVGSSVINNPKWDIHFDNLRVIDGSNNGSSSISNDNNVVNYDLYFTIPGDTYEFLVDVVNSGTIDGMIDSTISKLNGELITDLPSYLEYSVTYSDGEEILPNQVLFANEYKTIRVRVSYKRDITVDDIPDSIEKFRFSYSMKYIQFEKYIFSSLYINHN
ncbi:MAG: hypothetical protein IKF37_01245 [Bacilli bacterium]|nr:hypothetical protein [Bacilli bacterium]